MDGSNEQIQFSWGKLRGKGGVKMDTQFYESFTLDNVKYSLYDCVYLFKHGDPEPYIGKILKIWEQNRSKKVKILWFFLPKEIQKYLRGSVVENEIFLASGDGIGLADVNPLVCLSTSFLMLCVLLSLTCVLTSYLQTCILSLLNILSMMIGVCYYLLIGLELMDQNA